MSSTSSDSSESSSSGSDYSELPSASSYPSFEVDDKIMDFCEFESDGGWRTAGYHGHMNRGNVPWMVSLGGVATQCGGTIITMNVSRRF